MMNKEFTRRAFFKTTIAGTVLAGADVLFGADYPNRSVNYEGRANVGRRAINAIEPDAPLTPPQAPRLGTVARTVNEAIKACLVVWGPWFNEKKMAKEYGYLGTASVVDYSGITWLETAKHVWDKQYDGEEFTLVDYWKNTIALCRGRKGVALRQRLESTNFYVPRADRKIVIPGHSLFLTREQGDVAIMELPNDGIPGVLSLERASASSIRTDSILYVLGTSNLENRKSSSFEETVEKHVVRIRQSVLSDLDAKNESDFRAFRLESLDDNFVIGDSGCSAVNDTGGNAATVIQLRRPVIGKSWPDREISSVCLATSSEDIFNAVARAWEFGYLGVKMIGDADLTVRGVDPNSPAENAGLQIGDEIVALDQHAIADFNHFQRYIAARGPAKTVVVFKRDGRTRQVAVTLGRYAV